MTAPSDIAGHPLSGHVLAAYESGCLSGYPDGTFHPDAPVTRAELAVAVACLAGIPPHDPVPAPPDPCRNDSVNQSFDIYACFDDGWTDSGADVGALASMHNIVACESGWNPAAVNTSSGAAGLAQFLWSTFNALRARHPDIGPDPHDPYTAGLAAGHLYRESGFGPWECRP